MFRRRDYQEIRSNVAYKRIKMLTINDCYECDSNGSLSTISMAVGEANMDNLDWCRCLLKAPAADQTIRHDTGNTPLHIACAARFQQASFCKFIRFLVENQPYVVTIHDKKGLLPFHLACMNDGRDLGTIHILLRLNPIESLALF